MDGIRRKIMRLSAYDYSQPGAYFVTICVHGRRCIFGTIKSDVMHLSTEGLVVAETWGWLAARYPYVQHDLYVVMPNHLHGIVILRGDVDYDVAEVDVPEPGASERKSLGGIVGAFKTVSTKRISHLHGVSCRRIWQRGFYEHVIRDETSLHRVREYIEQNPLAWNLDVENPDRVVP